MPTVHRTSRRGACSREGGTVMEQPPNCQECGKPLKAYPFSAASQYGWAGNGYFCTKDCAAYWAVSKARKEER